MTAAKDKDSWSYHKEERCQELIVNTGPWFLDCCQSVLPIRPIIPKASLTLKHLMSFYNTDAQAPPKPS